MSRTTVTENAAAFDVDSGWPVRVDLPPEGRFGRVARATASACGVLEEFSVDELADLRLVVNEVFYALATIGTGPISIRLSPRAGVVNIAMSARQRAARSWHEPDLQMLRTLVDVMVERGRFENGGQRFTFTGSIRSDRD